jgi:protein phosphatase
MSFFSRLFGQRPSPVKGTVEINAVAAPAELRAVTAWATDVGCVREINEDAVRVERPAGGDDASQFGVLLAVCDGMGGHEGGEVASRLAMETLVQSMRGGARAPGEQLRLATEAANLAVFDAARREPRLKGMGTTCTALLLRDGLAYCAHVGDSRCYMVRDGELFLMTEDHSAVMDLVRRGVINRDEARHHPDKNVISRALGSHARVDVTTWPQALMVRAGDRFVLCSDGLYDLVTDDTIRDTVLQHEPQAACDALVALARQQGGFDNVSVTIMEVARPAHAALKATRSAEVSP